MIDKTEKYEIQLIRNDISQISKRISMTITVVKLTLVEEVDRCMVQFLMKR